MKLTLPATLEINLPSRFALLRALLEQIDYVIPRHVRRLRHVRTWPVEWRERLNRITDEERTQLTLRRNEQREKAATRKQLRDLAAEYRRLLSNALTRAGAAYRFKEEGHRIVKRVRFIGPARVSPEAIWYQVDTARLPWQVLINFLKDDAVVETLSYACRRRVRVIGDDPEHGFWYIVELKQGVRGIPRDVDYSKMLDAMKPDAPTLTIPIGAGEAGRLYYRDISDMPHMIVAGATGSGKSVWVKQVLTTLVMRNDPNLVRLILVDLKAGVELTQFAGLPHLLMPIVKQKDYVIPTLKLVLREVRERLERFERKGVVDIRQYSQRFRPRLPYWVMVIDELAHVMLDNTISKDKEIYLADIAALSRAAGIHVILATQRPSVDVVTGLIKANFPARVAFSTASQADSRVIIDTGDACQISPQGRMVFMMGNLKVELQGPFISTQLIEETMKQVAGGQREAAFDKRKRHGITVIDLFRHALSKYEGKVSPHVLHGDFRTHGMSRPEIFEMVTAYQGKNVEIDGEWYHLHPPMLETKRGAKMHSRRLEKIEPPTEATDDEQPPTIYTLSDVGGNEQSSANEAPTPPTNHSDAQDNGSESQPENFELSDFQSIPRAGG